MNNARVWINGRFTDREGAKISVYDRGFLYGDGVFETMRAYAGVIFRLDAHLDRLFGSLRLLNIKFPYTRQYLKKSICRTIQVNGLESAYVRLTVTRGQGSPGIDCNGPFKATVIIAANRFIDCPGCSRARGVRVKTAATRQNEYSPLSGVKSMNFLQFILARSEARKGGFAEAILINTGGYVAEAACANIFLVKNGMILTPSLESGILPGIARRVVIDMAKALKLKVREKKILLQELMNADEVFLTNSLIEILPVTGIDLSKVGSGRPGEITKLLHISYQKEVIREVFEAGLRP